MSDSDPRYLTPTSKPTRRDAPPGAPGPLPRGPTLDKPLRSSASKVCRNLFGSSCGCGSNSKCRDGKCSTNKQPSTGVTLELPDALGNYTELKQQINAISEPEDGKDFYSFWCTGTYDQKSRDRRDIGPRNYDLAKGVNLDEEIHKRAVRESRAVHSVKLYETDPATGAQVEKRVSCHSFDSQSGQPSSREGEVVVRLSHKYANFAGRCLCGKFRYAAVFGPKLASTGMKDYTRLRHILPGSEDRDPIHCEGDFYASDEACVRYWKDIEKGIVQLVQNLPRESAPSAEQRKFQKLEQRALTEGVQPTVIPPQMLVVDKRGKLLPPTEENLHKPGAHVEIKAGVEQFGKAVKLFDGEGRTIGYGTVA